MSDPLGRHYCPHANDVNEFTGDAHCVLLNRRVSCCGVIEECIDVQCPVCGRYDDVGTIHSLGECSLCDHVRGDVNYAERSDY